MFTDLTSILALSLESVKSGGNTLLWFFFVIGIMIFVHELGHFLVAKSLKIRVETFSLGFGPKLIGFRRGNTDYRIALLPLGGYVKMAGESYEEAAGSPDEFLSRSKYQRLMVAFAGPAMNIVLALVLMTAYCMIGVHRMKFLNEPAYIGGMAKGTPAEQGGLQVGDKIVKINGESVGTMESAFIKIAINSKQKQIITVERQGQLLDKEVIPARETPDEIGIIGIEPFMAIEAIQPNSPADQAGLRSGDIIVKAEAPQQSGTSYKQVLDIIGHHPNVPLNLTVRRGALDIFKTVTPALNNGVGRIGIVLLVSEKYPFPRAVIESVNLNAEAVYVTFQVLRGLFAGKASIKNISGPIGIAQMSGEAARGGKSSLLQFMSMVSLNLGVFNLLPIPILDGGVIFLIFLEGLRRKDFSIAIKEKIVYVGLIFLVVLMGIVIVNDLSKIPLVNQWFK
ncbi:MAG: RIP metalloprotease RseP [Acidobacteria bacterium]|nr:RIP metalloprotease RseP [Acidobacteriota bacterium]MBI3654853.1 RIP metalloprotease RseP [Acidobacteriota bacterium]